MNDPEAIFSKLIGCIANIDWDMIMDIDVW